MSRRALLLLLVLLAGCGTEPAAAPKRAKPDAQQDHAAIQARVAAYVKYMLAGDGARACAQFTPAYRRDLDARAKDAGIGDCAEVLSAYGQTVSTGMPKRFAADAAKPERVVVLQEGDTAQASVKSPSGGLSVKRTLLRRVGSQWLIDELGLSRG
ncbi:hypothetical protein OM076_36825 [Solirubrobacter ginsenosidimutans]|uniref:Lipoprotein n=1 Tax=Solirubrobacter ginsenosidimutans TaxID=490573 RepID=A0A9X3N2K9_9ACTN|nr:hypothetical protein [Solirubrobacter ginsenosidimutans]MDA0165888.1 hypothetical protein [Solirubrobacter ginsenosidimutans]